MNPADEVSIRRVVNVPKRGVGDTSVDKVAALAAAQSIGLSIALRRAESAGVGGAALRGIKEFVSLVDSLADEVVHGPAHLLRELLERSGYLAELHNEDTIESQGRLENLDELVAAAEEFPDANDFLEKVSLVSDTDELAGDDKVMMMTLHAAKGSSFRRCSSSEWKRECFRTVVRCSTRRRWKKSAASPTSASRAPSVGSISPTPGAAACTARVNTTRRRGFSTRFRVNWSIVRAASTPAPTRDADSCAATGRRRPCRFPRQGSQCRVTRE